MEQLKKKAIIIFVKAPRLGKVKTRLAKTIGDENALKVYEFLLKHTYQIVKKLNIPLFVFYDDKIVTEDLWKGDGIFKVEQFGNELGEKMTHAFNYVFDKGYTTVLIIGSDCFELTAEIIEEAFMLLNKFDTVLGPAKDGGYYLLGMQAPFKQLFDSVEWSTNTVAAKTLDLIKQNKLSVTLLPVLSDVDTEEDINFTYQ